MKAWWKIHDKPRGRWRPLAKWGITLTAAEAEEADALNVARRIAFCFLSREGTSDAGVCSRDGYSNPYERKTIYACFPGPLYTSDASREGSGYKYTNCSRCSSCRFDKALCNNGSVDNYNWSVRLPWRPGTRPDYSDFIEPIRKFLCLVLEELERRFQEARESAPSDEWLLEEEFDSFSWRTLDSGVEVAERKLRVIRR